jgi:arginine decarboxylase
LASRYNIQLNKTSRNSVLLQSNINNTRSDVAHLIRVLVKSAAKSSGVWLKAAQSQAGIRCTGEESDDRCRLAEPRISTIFRKDAGKRTNEGDIRAGFTQPTMLHIATISGLLTRNRSSIERGA